MELQRRRQNKREKKKKRFRFENTLFAAVAKLILSYSIFTICWKIILTKIQFSALHVEQPSYVGTHVYFVYFFLSFSCSLNIFSFWLLQFVCIHYNSEQHYISFDSQPFFLFISFGVVGDLTIFFFFALLQPTFLIKTDFTLWQPIAYMKLQR